MHNWYGIETEAEFRRQEWQRAIEAEERAAQACAGRVASPRFRLPRLSLARLRGLGTPRLPATSPVAPPRAAAYSSK
jgi:hypothetical protein